MSLPYPPPYQDITTLSEHICAAESTIENWVRLGLFPEPRKVGASGFGPGKKSSVTLPGLRNSLEHHPTS
jgi:hypothetical protein